MFGDFTIHNDNALCKFAADLINVANPFNFMLI